MPCLCICKTCKRLYSISTLHIVWLNAYRGHILANQFPYPWPTPGSSVLNATNTERRSKYFEREVLHAYRRSVSWLEALAGDKPRKCHGETKYELGASGTPIHDVFWIKGPTILSRGMFLTFSQSIWSKITVWELPSARMHLEDVQKPRRCAVWSPRGAIFRRLCMNSEWAGGADEGLLAISFSNGDSRVEILQLIIEARSAPNQDPECMADTVHLRTIKTIFTKFNPTAMKGNILAISNDVAQTTIWDWKNDKCATLEHPTELDGVWQYDHCLEISFVHESILIVRARSVYLFPQPSLRSPDDNPLTYQPIARCSFGWIESVSISLPPLFRGSSEGDYRDTRQHPPRAGIQILIRAERDDAWDSDLHKLKLYTLQPNPHYQPDNPNSSGDTGVTEAILTPLSRRSLPSTSPSNVPYLFPPILTSEVHSTHGPMRVTGVFLGPYGTAFWIQPQDRSASGLIWGYHDELQHQHLHDEAYAQAQAFQRLHNKTLRKKPRRVTGRMGGSHIGLVSSEAVWGSGLGAGIIEGAGIPDQDWKHELEGLDQDAQVTYTANCESLVSVIFPGILAGGLLESTALGNNGRRKRLQLNREERQRSPEFELGRDEARTMIWDDGWQGLYGEGVLKEREIDRLLDQRELKDSYVERTNVSGQASNSGAANQVMRLKGRPFAQNLSNDWTSLDYDEGMGRVILGSRSGCVTVIEL